MILQVTTRKVETISLEVEVKCVIDSPVMGSAIIVS